ncbi:bifunctional copper resistance protein CopD/cytochrome c oxidase assembly protein [Micrococcales bacterium 31B]|nr:bifunctional copper resistance protein CopD/cytochrome c oxidase assembly protein [Micrococcales bacterium 31B]
MTSQLTPAPSRALWLALAAALGALLVTLASLAFTGAAAPLPLQDPGALVRWGTPLLSTLNDVLGALTVGSLVLLAGALGFPDARHRAWQGPWAAAHRIACMSSIAWTFAGLLHLFFYASSISGVGFTDPAFGTTFGQAMDTDLARALLATVVLTAVTATVIVGSRSLTGAGIAAALAVVAVLPKSLTGHAAGASDHETAVTGMALHLLGASLWLGGVLVLCLLGRSFRDDSQLAAVMRRFSTLALICFVLVSLSGVAASLTRLASWSDLGTRWGLLLLAKVAALVLVGAAGAWHRGRLLGTLGSNVAVRRVFWRVMAAEAVLLVAASGFAGALAASAPPNDETVVLTALTPAELLTGYPLPPELTSTTFWTLWRPDLFGITLCAVLSVTYAASLVKLARRGDAWPVVRSVSWFAGIAVLAFAINGSPGVYGRILFSSHMVEHMLLSMLIPLLLTGGAPVSLFLRALAPRKDGSRGAREWLLWLLDSRYGRFMTHPIVAAVNFAGGLIVFYYSDIFRWVMVNHVGHVLMIVHFLLVGYVFCNSLVGIDPTHTRFGYPIRLVMLLATMGFHAFFGVTLMSSQALLLADWFGATGRPWGPSALADQQQGGEIAWGIGEVPTVALALLVARQWFASEQRLTRRRDRKVDRDGDAELEAYNRMLKERSGGA